MLKFHKYTFNVFVFISKILILVTSLGLGHWLHKNKIQIFFSPDLVFWCTLVLLIIFLLILSYIVSKKTGHSLFEIFLFFNFFFGMLAVFYISYTVYQHNLEPQDIFFSFGGYIELGWVWGYADLKEEIDILNNALEEKRRLSPVELEYLLEKTWADTQTKRQLHYLFFKYGLKKI